jgi:hypothetical protein
MGFFVGWFVGGLDGFGLLMVGGRLFSRDFMVPWRSHEIDAGGGMLAVYAAR